MTVSVLQERQNSLNSANAASIALAFSNPVTPGSSIHVICSGVDTATSFTCSDSVNGSYGAALDTIDQAGDTQRLAHFKFDNTAAGTPTVTITPNTSIGFLAIWIREIGGTSGYDSAHKTALQTALGNGTDNVTTGTQAPNNQPGLLSALGVCTSNFVIPAAGTGFTSGISGWSFTITNTAVSESKRYTSLSAIAATFSNSGGSNNFATLAAFFKEAASATVAVGRSAQTGPGVSPDSRQMFRARPLSNIASPDITVGLTGQSISFASGTFASSSAVALSGQAATLAAGQVVAVLPAVGASVYSGPGISPDYRQLFRARTLSSTIPATPDVTVGLTGQSAGFSQGTVTLSSTVVATGQQSIATAGTVVASTQSALTGRSATTTAGAVFAASQIVVTGQAVTTAAGVVGPGNQLTLTGQSASSSTGSAAISSQVAITGLSASFTAGTVSPSGAGSATLTGQAATFAPGTAVVVSTLALTGQRSTFASGTAAAGLSAALTGQASTFNVGTLGPNITVALTGQSSAFLAGNVSAPNSVFAALTGQSSTFSSGSLTPSSAVTATGQSTTSSAGTLAAAKTVALTGSGITSALGTLLGSYTVGLTGQSAIFAAGLVLPPGDKTASLTGSVATFRTGAILPIGAVLSGTPRYVVRRLKKRIFTVSAVSYLEFPPKDIAEEIKLEFDFSPDLDTGVLLSGTPTVSVTVSGVDPTPNNIFNGLPRFDLTSTQVIVPVMGGIANCDYDIKVVVPTTDSLTVLALSGILPVRA